MNDRSRWMTTYEAVLFGRAQGKKVSTASIRRACEIGAIPFGERHAIGNDRQLWLIPQRTLSAWLEEAMPGRHHYQAELIRSGKRLIPQRLREARDYGACRHCGHDLEPGVTDWCAKGESGEMVIVRNSPAIVCPQCGEATAETGELDHIHELIASGRGEVAQHLVLQYELPAKDTGAEGQLP